MELFFENPNEEVGTQVGKVGRAFVRIKLSFDICNKASLQIPKILSCPKLRNLHK